MYRQIRVDPKHWPLQRILWKDQDGNELVYHLTTVTYGLACAPFLSLRVIQQLIHDEGTRYPLAVLVLRKGRYVDDIFGGTDTLERAQEITNQLTKLCMAGGFKLQKWINNNPSVLNSIQTEKWIELSSIRIKDEIITHTLGLSWLPEKDAFKFTAKLITNKVITKRTILSTIARTFDPLGLLSPVTIAAKILIQQLWILKLDWDDPLPDHIRIRWLEFKESLQFSLLSFPRWIHYKAGIDMEVHEFCDSFQ